MKDPNFIFGQTYVSNDESYRKCQKACEAYGETQKIRNPNKHTRFDKIQMNIGELSNMLSRWVKHQWLVFTLGIAGVRESVRTWVVGTKSLISCKTRNIPYRIALFIWNVIGRFHVCHCMCILGGE